MISGVNRQGANATKQHKKASYTQVGTVAGVGAAAIGVAKGICDIKKSPIGFDLVKASAKADPKHFAFTLGLEVLKRVVLPVAIGIGAGKIADKIINKNVQKLQNEYGDTVSIKKK